VLVLEQQRRRPCLLVKLLRDPLPLRELVEVRLLQLVGLMHLPIVALADQYLELLVVEEEVVVVEPLQLASMEVISFPLG
jgi:hypothetical protein